MKFLVGSAGAVITAGRAGKRRLPAVVEDGDDLALPPETVMLQSEKCHTRSKALFGWGVRTAAFCALAGADAWAAEPRLTYTIDTLNQALAAVTVEGGADGTERSFLLTHRLGHWARFNWPRFALEPEQRAQEVRFSIRRDGAAPESCTIRLLSDDGVEWQSPSIALTEVWQEVVLQASQFRAFRGAGPEATAAFSLDRAVQFQIVPAASGTGEGRLLIDEIRFLPHGPRYTAEGEDIRVPAPPVEMTRQRLADLGGRLRHERTRLKQRRAEAATWLAQIEEMRALWKAGRNDEIASRVASRSFVWQNQSLFRADAATRTATRVPDVYEDPDAWHRKVDAFSKHPPAVESPSEAAHPPDPVDAVFASALADIMAGITRDRLALYELRDRIARAESAEYLGIDLRAVYLASFIGPYALQSAKRDGMPEPVLADREAFKGRIRADAIVTRSLWRGGVPVIRVEGRSLGAAALRAELRDDDGRLIATARGPATGVDLDASLLQPWSTAAPHRGLLRAAVTDPSGGLLADDERAAAFRTANLTTGGPDAMLRHVTRPGQPDWSFVWNGRPWFPRMTRYEFGGGIESLPNVRRLLDDLWLDGQRNYGTFKSDASLFEAYDRLGLALLPSYAPSYRKLRDWDDVEDLRRNLDLHCAAIRADADRPHNVCVQVGNEVELAIWGATLADAFPAALYHPLDIAAQAAAESSGATAPVMYVRAGSFSKVPPLPHEDVCGVNQYTGRYGGRIDEIARSLGELARHAMVCDRPVFITEWMGPQYTWAATGIGGVTPRGAAYYLERYWRAMVHTPGIVGSSEFTLNWAIAPFEDLTNMTREEAWKDRPRHIPFGGTHTADHVPLVPPERADRGPSYRSMQAIHSPLYLMVNRPGPIRILQADPAEPRGRRIAEHLRIPGKTVETASWVVADALAEAPGHVLVLSTPGTDCPPLDAAIARGHVTPLAAGTRTPSFQAYIDPTRADRLIVMMQALDEASAEAGIRRLEATAAALKELNSQEGAMSRVVVLADKDLVRYYESYLLEFAARGYVFGGDDTMTRLSASRFFDEQGERRIEWLDLSAVILDATRRLTEEEISLIEKFVTDGIHLVISRPCYLANPGLQTRFPATLTRGPTLADRLIPEACAQQPLAVRDMGGADMDAIRRFGFTEGVGERLDAWTIEAEEAEPVACAENGRAVAVRWTRGASRVVLLGVGIGAVGQIHSTVGRAGAAHPLYDRDTACGLERLARVVINCCRDGWPDERPRPRLTVRITPDATLIPMGKPVRVAVELIDVEGRPVAGQLRARARTVADGRVIEQGGWFDVPHTSAGRYEVVCRPSTKDGLSYQPNLPGEAIAMVSIQLKAWAANHIPADEAIAIALRPETTMAPLDDHSRREP